MEGREQFVISGISGRYPESRNLDEFWSNLLAGKDLATIDSRRWPPTYPNIPPRSAKIMDAELFDAEFFKLSPDSSNKMYICLRVLHEIIYEALIDAGLKHEDWQETKTGIALGSSVLVGNFDVEDKDSSFVESTLSYLSYSFNFKGPVIQVDTACAASSSALDIAIQKMLVGECDQMIVAAYNFNNHPMLAASFTAFGMTSMEGKSKCLDANANGYCRSESIVAMLIQRKSVAKRIYGSLSHVETNCDGYTEEGITFPRHDTQCSLLKSLFQDLKLDPLDINYVEGHITGTQAGDPTECASIFASVRPNSEKPLLIGCLKSNIGHAEGSATLNAVSKVVKIFQTGLIPANLHYKEPNPKIDGLVKGILVPVLSNTKFDDNLILVNSFGFGGVNNSFVLEANSKRVQEDDLKLTDENNPRLVLICNRTPSGLDAIVRFLNEQKGSLTKYTLALLNNMSKTKPSDGFNHRGYVMLNNEQMIIHKLFQTDLQPNDEQEPWFVFTPMFNVASQTLMELLDLPIIYSRVIEMQKKQLTSHGIDIIKMIECSQQDLTSFLISSIAIQIALFDLFVKQLGIKPKGIIGHSIGLIAAAYADNCITDEDALLIGYHIGKACKQLKGQGAMVCVNLPWKEVEKMKPEGVEIASHELEDWTMVTGNKDSIDNFVSKMDTEVNIKIIDTKQIPFNSSLLSNVSRLVTIELNKFVKVLKVNSKTLKSTCCLNGIDPIPENQSIDTKLFTDSLQFPCNLHEIQQQLPPNSLSITFGSSGCNKLQPEDHKIIHLIMDGISDGTKLNLNQYKPSIMSLYTTIGDIYLQGLNPKIENLYDPIEYPVPRETQSIAHLIKWKHDVKWFVSLYSDEKTLDRIVIPIELIDPTWRFLEGHKIDRRMLFPATGYLYVAWYLFCCAHHCDVRLQPIEFYQVQFLRATQFENISSSVNFQLKYNRDAGTFLILADKKTNICVTGKYRLVKKPSIYFNESNDISKFEEYQELVLKKEDIYKEFRIRGYDYSGAFQGIEEASAKGHWAKIKDSGNWISFADACCQTILLASQALKSIVPIFMDYIYMDPTATEAAFKDQALNLGHDSVNNLTVYHNPNSGVIQSKGLIVKGMVGQEVKRRMTISSVRIAIQQNMSLDSDRELPVDIKGIQECYTSYCMKLIEILKDWKHTKQFSLTEENEKDLESIEQYLSRNGESHTLLRILNETIKLIQADKTNLHDADYIVDAKLDEIYKQYADCLLKDCLFMKPLENLTRSMMSIIRYNEKSMTDSLVLVNFLKIPSEIELSKQLTTFGTVYSSTEYTIEDKIADKLSTDTGFIKIDSAQNTRINEAKSYDVAVIRDKSTYLMMKDENPELQCNQFASILQLTFNSLKEGGFCFILTRTKLSRIEQEWQQLIDNQEIEINFDEESIKSVACNLGFILICCKELKSNGFYSILLRRPNTPSPDQKISFIRVKVDNLDWIERVKEAVKDKDHKIWLTGGGYDNGMIGMVKCLIKEKYNLNCYYDPSKGDDEEIIVPDDVLIKDLVINHVDSSGSTGVYENIPIDIDEFQVETTSCYADSKSKGDLSSLRWFQSAHSKWTHIPKEKLKFDHAKVTIYYSSLNFKDVLIATGRFPVLTLSVDIETVKATAIGLEYSGIDKTGHRVMGLCDDGGIATSLVAYSEFAKIQIPDNWTLAEAATVPVVHLTSYYGLISRGKLKNGESVLIHAGSGGVGQAAISICLARGCEVFTTVGTQEKRDFIKKRFPSIDDDHIGDSRSTSFEDLIMKMTNSRGVNLVLNSLSDEKFHASVRCLADFGRFIEIGKYDMIINTKIEAELFNHNKTYHSCCLGFLQDDVLFKKIPARIKLWESLLNMLHEGINTGEVVPLPSTIFQMNQLEESFRFMATGKHIGKVLIQMRDETEDPNAVKLYPAIGQTFFDLEKSYIITGGLGGMGLEVAYWMVQRGATNLILTSRSGLKTKYQEYILDKIKNNNYSHANVLISNEDCLSYESTERLINQAEELGPIGGVFHLAMVLKDGLFENQSIEDFEVGVKPKAIACRYLDQLTRSLPYKLDYFVCFSSISSDFGNPGQSNYNFGNASIEFICVKRREDGHHGLAIRWGLVGDVGAVTESETRTNEILTILQAIRLPLVLHLIDKILCTPHAIYSAVSYSDDKRASYLRGTSLKQTILNVLGIKNQSKVDPSSTLNELGLDSLMAVEIKQTLETEYNHSMTTQEIRNLKVYELDELEKKIKANIDEKKISQLDTKVSSVKMLIRIPTEIFSPLNGNETGPLFFYFPQVNNSFEAVIPVFEQLPNRFIGVNWVKEIQKASTIKEMVNFYVDALVDHYPNEKTFSLIGYSFGGVVALQVAIELQKRIGYMACRYLIILDISPDVLVKRVENVIKRYEGKDTDDHQVLWGIDFLSQFFQLSSWTEVKEKLLTFKTQQERYQFITEMINQKTSSEFSVNEISEASEFYSSKQKIISLAEIKDKYYGDVFLVKATEIEGDKDAENIDELHLEDYGLSKYVKGSITISEVPGNHDNFVAKNPGMIRDLLENLI